MGSLVLPPSGLIYTDSDIIIYSVENASSVLAPPSAALAGSQDQVAVNRQQ
jgi:hypothetical protein